MHGDRHKRVENELVPELKLDGLEASKRMSHATRMDRRRNILAPFNYFTATVAHFLHHQGVSGW